MKIKLTAKQFQRTAASRVRALLQGEVDETEVTHQSFGGSVVLMTAERLRQKVREARIKTGG